MTVENLLLVVTGAGLFLVVLTLFMAVKLYNEADNK